MLIGITGTDGSGKGTVVDYLVKNHGFVHYSARELIVEEIKRRGLPVIRKNMRLVANHLRQERGRDVIVQVALEKMQSEKAERVIVESLRALAEVETLKKAGGVLLAVDADQKLRYDRIVSRQSESDQVSFTEFQAQEELEMNDPDPNGMQKAAVMKVADHTIMNEGTFEALAESIESVYAQIHD